MNPYPSWSSIMTVNLAFWTFAVEERRMVAEFGEPYIHFTKD